MSYQIYPIQHAPSSPTSASPLRDANHIGAAIFRQWAEAEAAIAERQCHARWLENRNDIEMGLPPRHAMTPDQLAAAKRWDAIVREPAHRAGLRFLQEATGRREREQVRVDLEFEPWE